MPWACASAKPLRSEMADEQRWCTSRFYTTTACFRLAQIGMDAVRATLEEIGRWTHEQRSDRLEVSDLELRCYVFLMPFCAGAPSRLAVTALALRAERALVLLVDDFNRLGPTWSVFGSTAQCFLCSVMRQRLVYNIANIEP